MQSQNLTLVLDTVSSIPSISLFSGDEEVDRWRGAERTSDNVLSSIIHLLQTSGLKVKKLDKIIVTVGPGSLTGIRLGLAIAKGLSFKLKIKCIGVSNLATLAAFAFVSSNRVEKVRVFIIGNQRKTVFQDFLKISNSSFTVVDHYQLLENNDLEYYLSDYQLNVIYCRSSYTSELLHKKFRQKVKFAPSELSRYAFIASLSLPMEAKPLYVSSVTFKKIT